MNISAASDYLEKWLLERDASVRNVLYTRPNDLPKSKRWHVHGLVESRNNVGPARRVTLHFDYGPSVLMGSQSSLHNGLWLDRQLARFHSQLAADMHATNLCIPPDTLTLARTRVPTSQSRDSWVLAKIRTQLRAAFDSCPEQRQRLEQA